MRPQKLDTFFGRISIGIHRDVLSFLMDLCVLTTVLFVDQAQEELKTKFGKYMKAVIDMTKIDGEPYIT